jgi:hypothetical protein
MIVLGHDGHGRLELEGRCELKSGEGNGGMSFEFSKQLKVTPHNTKKRSIRMYYSE